MPEHRPWECVPWRKISSTWADWAGSSSALDAGNGHEHYGAGGGDGAGVGASAGDGLFYRLRQ